MTLVKNNGSRTLKSVLSDFFDSDGFFPLSDRLLPSNFLTARIPAVNIKESDKEFTLDFAVPGMKKEDFKLSIEDDMLSISASTKSEKEEKTADYTRQEYNFNSFTRSFTLPENVLADKIVANYNDGILKLTIPKSPESPSTKKREINIG